jgi:hypothetical protein
MRAHPELRAILREGDPLCGGAPHRGLKNASGCNKPANIPCVLLSRSIGSSS